jgi:sulfate adenylyltransferase subunit 1
MDVLRFATAGSVDDGKSTLIGRLLHDSKSLLDDTIAAVGRATEARGGEGFDLALVTDGLRAEREQGITIDVAYRYFATANRTFVIADTPGHVQYTRNMVTGASTSDVAVILVDAQHGLREQSYRHAQLVALLGIRHLIFAVNKMDLVDWSEARFNEIAFDITVLADRLGANAVVIPLSALTGSNVVHHAGEAAWYSGPTLLGQLEAMPLPNHNRSLGARLPIQWVARPKVGSSEPRWYAGPLSGGELGRGDEVLVLPSGRRTRIANIDGTGVATRVQLDDEIDVARGDMLVAASAPATVVNSLLATVCWMVDTPLTVGDRLLIKHTSRVVKSIVADVHDRLDITTGVAGISEGNLFLNDIGTVALRLASPLVVDDYSSNRSTGSFIGIDESTNATVLAGMIRL